jgi:hypothetical protein
MKNRRCSLLLMVFLIAAPVCARADLDGFLAGLNNQAHNDMNDYNVRLSVQFGVPLPQVQSLIRSAATPGDAFMCLQLAQMTLLPVDRVLQTYRVNRGKGWGVTAKELGVKPGSAEFHALKRGDFVLAGAPGAAAGANGHENSKAQNEHQGGGHGNGKGKGHNK